MGAGGGEGLSVDTYSGPCRLIALRLIDQRYVFKHVLKIVIGDLQWKNAVSVERTVTI